VSGVRPLDMADLCDERESRASRQPMPVAVLGDGNAGHVLHHEERPIVSREAGIKDGRD
jgi:hypothetical protein